MRNNNSGKANDTQCSGMTTTVGDGNNYVSQVPLVTALERSEARNGTANSSGDYGFVVGVEGYNRYGGNISTEEMMHTASPYFHSEKDIDAEGCSPCSYSSEDGGKTTSNFLFSACCGPDHTRKRGGFALPFQQLWSWEKDGNLKLSCKQPIVCVPVIQEIQKRDKIIEVPQVDLVDAILPKVYNQGVKHDVPKMAMKVTEKILEIPKIKYIDKEVIVPVVTGYSHKFVPKWEIRQVPRPIVKYVGEQQIIEVEVPQIKFVDKIVEREVIVDTVKKKVPKIIEIPKYVDTIKYVWKPIEKIVPLKRFVPKFDVALECPAPLIVPFPVKRIKEMKSILMRKSPKGIEIKELDIGTVDGAVRVPDEYIKEYTKQQHRKSECCSARCGLSCNNSAAPGVVNETAPAIEVPPQLDGGSKNLARERESLKDKRSEGGLSDRSGSDHMFIRSPSTASHLRDIAFTS